jgi:ATP-binding cassette subfamily B protein
MKMESDRARESGVAPAGGKLRRGWRKWRAFLSVGGRFTPYLRGRVGALGLAFAALMAFTAMRLLEPWPVKLIIDNVLLEHSPPWFLPEALARKGGDPSFLLYGLVAAILVIAFGRGFFLYRQKLLIARLGIEITAALRHDLYRHIQYLSLSFHDRRRSGDLLVRLTSDVRILRAAFVALPLEVMQGLLIMIGMTVVMLFMDWQLTLLALLLVPCIALLTRKYHRPMKKAVREQRKRESELATMASEALSAIRVVQGFRRERDEIKRFGGSNKGNVRSEVKAARYEAKLRWGSELAIAGITAVVVLLATRRILAESLSPGDLIVFLAYLSAYARPFRRVSGGAKRVIRAAAAGERVLEILDTEPAIGDASGAMKAPPFAGRITFDHVSFVYHDDTPVLSDVDLEIKAGERVAIVGQTGAGKSSLVSLIPRFYDPTRGRVCIDGHDIRDFTLSSLRKQISLVFQEPVLFATTIAENIAYGKRHATMEEVVKAAKDAAIDGHIARLRHGYDTVIGERGGTLSGGQRQCIAIARAMISNAPIIILDELTAGLDHESATMVLEALDHLMEGKTVVMISHDLAAVQNVDRIAVLEHGRVVQQGRYADLAAAEGLFQTLNRQVGSRRPGSARAEPPWT